MKKSVFIFIILFFACKEKAVHVIKTSEIELGNKGMLSLHYPENWKYNIYNDSVYPKILLQLDSSYSKFYKKGKVMKNFNLYINNKHLDKYLFYDSNKKLLPLNEPSLVKEFETEKFHLIIVNDSIQSFIPDKDENPRILWRVEAYITNTSGSQIDNINLGYIFEGNFISFWKYFYIKDNIIYFKTFSQDETEINLEKEEKYQITNDGHFIKID